MTDWAVVVPVKSWDRAKSRFVGLTPDRRVGLARALAYHTVRTVVSADAVRVCVVVAPPEVLEELNGVRGTGRARLIGVAEQVPGGLDRAFTAGLGRAVATGHPQVALVVSDLPLLRPDHLSRALGSVPPDAAGMVRDAEGTGTTMLAARAATRLRPSFGSGSAHRHLAAGAVDITALCHPYLRRDLDTAGQLADLPVVPGSWLAGWRADSAAGLPAQVVDGVEAGARP